MRRDGDDDGEELSSPSPAAEEDLGGRVVDLNGPSEQRWRARQ
jgi:hypothetical protein